MKTLNFLSVLFFVIVIVSCGPSRKDEIALIEQKENELFSEKGAMVNKEKAMELVGLYVQFADDHTRDSLAPEYLFKAADISMNMTEPNKAIDIYSRIREQYPNFRKAAECLFLQGFIYENQLGDLEMAKNIYQEFLDNYPENDFADDAEISIRNLGKSPEELIKEFEQQMKEQDSLSQEAS